MLRDRNIAFFIDVDNVGLKSDNYANVIEQLNAMGTILSGKIYGAGERKHKEIYADAELHGYRIERPMRVKRRGRKEFDPRIFVDVVDAVARTSAIDAVCIVAQPTDLVYLYSYLRSRGIKVIALDNADDASCAFIDEVVDLGIVLELKLPKQPSSPAVKPAPVAKAPEQPAPAEGLDRTDELLREIERLRQAFPEEQQAVSEQPQAEQTAVEEQPVAETPQEPQQASEEQPSDSTDEQTASIVDEAKSLLERIAEMRESTAPQQAASEQPVAEQPAEPVQETPSEPVQEPAPQVEQAQSYEPVAQQEESAPQSTQRTPVSNDSDLIRRIEEIRRGSQGGDEDFIAEIKKLLDGLE